MPDHLDDGSHPEAVIVYVGFAVLFAVLLGVALVAV